MEDVLRSLGYLCLGSRMKRLGEQLQADAQRLLDRLDPALQAGYHPLLAALDRLGPLTIGDLARALRISQPGVTRSVGRLVAQGLVAVRPADDDQRQRIVALTERGRTLVTAAKAELWPAIEAAVSDLCAGLSGPLLSQLASIEDGLAAVSLAERAAR